MMCITCKYCGVYLQALISIFTAHKYHSLGTVSQVYEGDDDDGYGVNDNVDGGGDEDDYGGNDDDDGDAVEVYGENNYYI